MQQDQTAPIQKELDITHDVIQVLKTVVLLERAYSAGYLVRLLRADAAYGLRKDAHKEIETFGILEEETYGYVDDLIHYLIREGYLKVVDPRYGTIQLSEMGTQFMNAPESIVVTPAQFRKHWYELEIMGRLRQLRKTLAEKEGKEPYELFNNFHLQQIAHEMPQTDEQLRSIPGLPSMKEGVRLLLLAEIHQVQEKKEIDDKTGVYRKASSSSHRAVQSLFESGYSLSEIARRRNMKEKSVQQYLENLHLAGKLDLRPWIEDQVDPKLLHKGSEYFKSVSQPRMKEAHEVLGLDYDVLSLCKLYAAEVREPVPSYT
ncbi:MAG: hypothetical protein OHK0039_02800 [Bacteroidia bacterium]